MNENDFVVGVLTYITCLREKKRYSTAKSYQDALRSFKCFCGREEIPYAYINRDTLLRYQSWLLPKGCARNTVSTYMRRIRHIYNLAVEVGEAAYIPHLFKNVFTGVESKRKKALPSESLRLLMTSPVTDPQQKRTQSAFCLMFLFCGMAFVDLAHLRKEDIKEGILSYYRRKSGSLIQIENATFHRKTPTVAEYCEKWLLMQSVQCDESWNQRVYRMEFWNVAAAYQCDHSCSCILSGTGKI